MTKTTFNSVIVIALFLCSIATFAADQPAAIKVACVGDSITYGARIEDRYKNSYPAQLAVLLGEKWIVRNFGVSDATLLKKGDKPYWKLGEFTDARAFKPNIVIIELGTNDSKPKNWKHKADYVSDYVELIDRFRMLDSKPVVWICFPAPAYPGQWGITDKVLKEEVIPLIDEVAQQAKVGIIDLYTVLSNRKEMFPDTVHPNAAGAKLMAETIAEVITGEKAQQAEQMNPFNEK